LQGDAVSKRGRAQIGVDVDVHRRDEARRFTRCQGRRELADLRRILACETGGESAGHVGQRVEPEAVCGCEWVVILLGHTSDVQAGSLARRRCGCRGRGILAYEQARQGREIDADAA
jgi:hypothetical protein